MVPDALPSPSPTARQFVLGTRRPRRPRYASGLRAGSTATVGGPRSRLFISTRCSVYSAGNTEGANHTLALDLDSLASSEMDSTSGRMEWLTWVSQFRMRRSDRYYCKLGL
jgi:hypothetical protein